MNSKKYWLVSGFYSIGAKVSVPLFGFGGFYFLVRTLKPEQFGIWALFQTIITIIETSRNGLIQNALIKFLHSNPEEKSDQIISASWVLNLVYSLLIIFLLLTVAKPVAAIFGSTELTSMFYWYFITLMLLVPISQFNYLQQANFSFGGIFWTAITRQGFFFVILAFIYFMEIDLSIVQLVLAQSVCVALGLVVSFLCARKYIKFSFRFDFEILKSVFNFGKYVMGTNLFALLYKSIDQLFIGYFAGPVSVAYYNAAIRVSNLIEYPASSVAEIVYPKATKKYEMDKELSSKYYYEMGVGLTLAMVVPVILFTVIFSEFIIRIIAGEQYMMTADLLRVTILFGIFTPFSRQFGAAMDSSGRPHLNFLILFISVLLNLVCNYIGITTWGLMGAAYGSLISYVIVGIVTYVIMYRIFNISILSAFQYMIYFYKQGFGFINATLKFR